MTRRKEFSLIATTLLTVVGLVVGVVALASRPEESKPVAQDNTPRWQKDCEDNADAAFSAATDRDHGISRAYENERIHDLAAGDKQFLERLIAGVQEAYDFDEDRDYTPRQLYAKVYEPCLQRAKASGADKAK
jgi:hypothetical protein